PRAATTRVLKAALQQTGSEYGFAGVTDGRTLRILNHEGVRWDDHTNREFYDRALRQYERVGYMEFTDFDNLFGQVLTTGRSVIANAPSADPRSGGLPPGHPPLDSFLGVPIVSGGRVAGLIGVANRPGGYGAVEQHRLEVLAQMAGVICDAYARQQAEAALKEHLRHTSKMEALGQLAGGIAHDFNNILTVIRGYADMVHDHVRDDPSVAPQVQEIRQAAESARTLVRQLLLFSRKQPLRAETIDLNTVITDMQQLLRRTLGEDIRVDLRLASEPVWIRADPAQLQQVVMNLAVNARDAMPAGGVLSLETAHVAIGAADLAAYPGARAGRYVRLAVSDTGTGMDPRTKERIFEPFFTTKPEGHGTGLGLAIVYGVVRQAGGLMRVESDLGRGSTFTLYFPEARAARQASPAPPAERPTRAGGHETVLLVEDDDGVRTFAARILAQHGYRVHAAASPAEALALAGHLEPPPDLLLIDVVMPGANGSNLVQSIRAARPGIRCLYMSGYSIQAIQRRGLALDDEPLLEKPFTAMELLARVRQALDR
ncbi:MAG TPA: ATP-binding protein, partial [Vicinamibacterales bacterium]|nr:ATP-binding protein [Vicinamibacterales bacterium]